MELAGLVESCTSGKSMKELFHDPNKGGTYAHPLIDVHYSCHSLQFLQLASILAISMYAWQLCTAVSGTGDDTINFNLAQLGGSPERISV